MGNHLEYAERVQETEKSLTGMNWLKLTYITKKSASLDGYMNYISSKFFPEKEQISLYDIEERSAIIETTIQSYKSIQQEIKSDHVLDSDLKLFLIKKIQESTNKAEIAKISLLFEAEKYGYDINFAGTSFSIKKNQTAIEQIGLWSDYEKEKNKYLEHIEDLQTATYGPKISDNPDEKNIILSLCNDKYQKNKKRLTQQEDILFSSFLDTFKDSITNTIPQDRKKLSSRGKLSMSTIMEGTEHVKTHFYPEITQRPQQQEKWKTWYAAPFSSKVREYPDKEEDIFNKILTTIGHEDAWHMIRWNNQEGNWLIIAWPWYEDIEEGITKLNEWLLRYSLDDYPLIPNDTFIAVFIGENYNFEATYHLLKAWKKLNISEEITKEKETSLSKIAFNLAQRVKCYYPRDEKGSNRKDVIYFRGEKKLVEYLKSLPNDEERAAFYRKAMSAKVSFEDIFTLDTLFQKLWVHPEDINQNKLVDKVFHIKLKEWAGAFSKKANDEWVANIEKNLWKWDFRFNGMKEYVQEEKKALVELFDMVHYKKYRGKYVQEAKWTQLKARDVLKKWNIVSLPTANGIQKAKVISSDLNELKVILQHDGKFTGWDIMTISKKDIKNLWEVRILNKQKK
jgi:hypothetical protein